MASHRSFYEEWPTRLLLIGSPTGKYCRDYCP